MAPGEDPGRPAAIEFVVTESLEINELLIPSFDLVEYDFSGKPLQRTVRRVGLAWRDVHTATDRFFRSSKYKLLYPGCSSFNDKARFAAFIFIFCAREIWHRWMPFSPKRSSEITYRRAPTATN